MPTAAADGKTESKGVQEVRLHQAEMPATKFEVEWGWVRWPTSAAEQE